MKTKEIYDGYIITEDGVLKNKFGNSLSFFDNGRGYLITSVSINGVRSTKALHRILAEAFIPNPENLSDVDHIDGDRRNNKLSNLRWLTHGENIGHSFTLDNRSATGDNNANCKTDVETVIAICKLLESGIKPSKIRDLGYDYGLVRAIKIRKNWCSISCSYSW